MDIPWLSQERLKMWSIHRGCETSTSYFFRQGNDIKWIKHNYTKKARLLKL